MSQIDWLWIVLFIMFGMIGLDMQGLHNRIATLEEQVGQLKQGQLRQGDSP